MSSNTFGDASLVETEDGYAAVASIDHGTIADMVRDIAGKIDAELFDRLAAERGYRKQNVDTAALLRIAARLEEDADYGSWQAETAGRIREAVEGEDLPEQVHDIPHCPRCHDDGFWRIAPADAEGFELLRCAGCGRDYRYKRPAKGGAR